MPDKIVGDTDWSSHVTWLFSFVIFPVEHIWQSVSFSDLMEFSGQTWLDWVVNFCVHHCVSEKALSIVSGFSTGPLEQLLSFQSDNTGKAGTHFADLPHLLRRAPFSQHRHAPHDCVSTLNA